MISRLLIGLLLIVVESAAASTCATSGGTMTCGPVIPIGPGSIAACDDAPSSTVRMSTWCSVFAGTWNGDTLTCGNPTVVLTSANASNLAGQFESKLHGDACSAVAPPQPPCSNQWCVCSTVYTGGVKTRDFSILPFNGGQGTPDSCSGWAENVIIISTQQAACSYGADLSGSGPAATCEMPKTCPNCGLGNPIDVGVGAKKQEELDYASPSPGGLRFARFYNSAGFYDVAPRAMTNDDVWRHTYSASIIPYVGNAYVMALAKRPNGDNRVFRVNGTEMHNNDGAAYRLAKLVDGSGNTTGWTLTTAESDIENYDSLGRLTSIVSRAGFTTTVTYDSNGRVAAVTDAYGRSLTLGYDASGRLATMTDPANRVTTYGYDSLGRMSTVTYPDSSVRTYLYQVTGLDYALSGIQDERGIQYATFGYDSQGRGVSTEHAGADNRFTFAWSDTSSTRTANVSDAFGSPHTYQFNKVNGTLQLASHNAYYQGTESWTYDANGNIASKTDFRGTVTNYSYDLARNLETSRTEAAGTSIARTITTTWHPTYRLPATITEPSGVSGINQVTTFTYDANGNLTKKNITAGSLVREWNYTVNALGQVLTIDGPRTDVTDLTTLTYYANNDTCVGCRGNVYTVTNAAGHVTTFNAYDADGRPTQITDPNGVVTTLTYKPRGWLASRSTAGETTTYDYGPSGLLSKITLPDGSFVSYGYDAAGALTGIDDSLGNSIEYDLDVMGNRVAEYSYDPQEHLKRSLLRVYDGANRLQKVIGSTNQMTQYTYDAGWNIKNVTDPVNQVTANNYDALNRLTLIFDALNGSTTFTYDAKDRLATVKDPKLSNATTYTYNGLGDLVTQVSPDTGTTTFTYDAAGNVATQTDARSVATTYTYDSLNRVTAATVIDGTVTYEYDNVVTGGYAKGRLTKVTDPSGNTTYAYDALGRVITKTQTVNATANKVFTVQYGFNVGRPSSLTYPSGRVATYGYNSQGQVTSIAIDGTTLLSGASYDPFGPVTGWTWANGQAMTRFYDLDGRVKTVSIGPSTATYADLSQVFGYDALNRLTSANLAAGQTQSLAYDSNGNRSSATINSALTFYNYPSTSHRLSSLSGSTSRSFTYDNAGNTTAAGAVTFVYDGRGRMKQAGTVTYLVNGLGQRVKKTNGADTFFAYDEAGHLIGEYDATGAPIEETVWLGDLPVAVIKPGTPSATFYYIWADNLGSPRQITDAANQSRWEWANNDPFGNNLPNENPSGLGVFSYNLRFPGQYYDAETGKHYNYFRDYDPGLGRYAEADLMGLRAGANLYGYVLAQPLTYMDLLGLQAAAGGAGVGGGSGAAAGGVGAGSASGSGAIAKGICDLLGSPPRRNCLPATGDNIKNVLAPDLTLTLQRTVSSPVIQRMVDTLAAGGELPPINVDNGVIVNGNHRYIAWRLCSMSPLFGPGTAPLSYPRYFMREVRVDSADWGSSP